MNTPERRAGRAPVRSVDHLRELADRIANGLLDRSLPKPRWTHEGHLLACVSLVGSHGAAGALAILRTAIPRYNESTGVANTPTGGYHDTITVYYVWAIDRLLGEGLATARILRDPTVTRTALLVWWDRDTLTSPAARAGWVEPTSTGDGGPSPTECLQPELTGA